jgi:hypothetical protein
MTNDTNTIFAKCPACEHSIRVTIGRKSTTRQVTCDSCGGRYEYSAWKLSQPRADGETVSLRSFYQVDLFPIEASHV